MTTKPLVSISCIAYNQALYIRQCLDSFIMQKTDFIFEVLIHDDASTDGTKEIIEEYASEYPNIIKPLYEKENQWQKGRRGSAEFNLPRAKGKYIALCEGDDFWTDDTKLQQQVDYMESNPETAICFHNVKIFFENGEQDDVLWPPKHMKTSLENLLRENFIPTNTVLYRKQDYRTLQKDVMPADWYMHLFHAQFGKINKINKEMSSYRRHSEGIWWDSHNNAHKLWIEYGTQFLKLDKEIEKMYGGNVTHRSIIDDRIYEDILTFARIDREHGASLLDSAMKLYPSYVNLFSKGAAKKIDELVETLDIRDKSIASHVKEGQKQHVHIQALTESVREQGIVTDDLTVQIKHYRDRLSLIEGSNLWKLRSKLVNIVRKNKSE